MPASLHHPNCSSVQITLEQCQVRGMACVMKCMDVQEAELQRQKAEREQALLEQQRKQDTRAQQEAAARAEQQRRAEEERQRQAAQEKRRQQQLRLEQDHRAAELKAQLEAEEARRRCAGLACNASEAHLMSFCPWNKFFDTEATHLRGHGTNGSATWKWEEPALLPALFLPGLQYA